MKTRFASFLLAGKVAALPLFVKESAASIQDIFLKNSPPTRHTGSSNVESPRITTRIADESLQSIVLRKNCCESHGPKAMNLVITGLHNRDEVLVLLSSEKETASLLRYDMSFLTDVPDMSILNRFSAVDTPVGLRQGVPCSAPVSLSLDVNSISELARQAERPYLHIIVAPNSQWDRRQIRYSDVYELRSNDKFMLLSQKDITEDCTPYTCY
jgi:hypothetical protein